MLGVNKSEFDRLVSEKKYVDAATLELVAVVGNLIGEQVNKVILTALCYNQIAFSVKDFTEEQMINDLLNIETDFFKKLVHTVILKLSLSNDLTTHLSNSIAFMDPRSMIADSILNLLSKINQPFVKNNPMESLIPDLLEKTIKQGMGIVRMLNLGLISDAFGSWRTFHESLCIIKLLEQGGEKTTSAYLKHIVYSNAFRGGISNEKESNNIFEQMKAEMRSHDLKSKDMKKFIEYGWLYSLSSFDEANPDYRLNFRDGIQRCADLRDYSEWYEAASELSHSSAIYFYSESEYFTNLTIHGFYDMLKILDELIFNRYYSSVIEKNENLKKDYLLLKEELLKMVEDQKCYFDAQYFEFVEQYNDQEDM